MRGMYLIPANSKKSMLIFGLFNKFDLILFGSGIAGSLLLLLILPIDILVFAVIALLPAGITGLMVMPIPNYHNILTFLRSMIDFYITRQKFIWKGWRFLDEFKEGEK